MAMLTQVTVTFTLEHLAPITQEAVTERVQEIIEPDDSENWFEDCESYAILQSESLTVELANGSAEN